MGRKQNESAEMVWRDRLARFGQEQLDRQAVLPTGRCVGSGVLSMAQASDREARRKRRPFENLATSA